MSSPDPPQTDRSHPAPPSRSSTAQPALPPPALTYVAHATIELDSPMEIGEVPVGRRRIIAITGGRFEGPGMNATIVSGGADWQVVAVDGTAIIDTRYAAVTESGAGLFIATQGFRHGPPEVLARLAAGEDVAADEYYFRLTARFETTDAELAWVNRTVFVATGARIDAAVHYDLYAVG